jgi:hypothetical protein
MSEMPPSPPPPPDNYGAPPPPDYSQLPPPPPPRDSDFAPVRVSGTGRTNQYAKLSLFLGSVGWLVCGVGSLAGVYFGFKALNQIKETGEDGRNKAIAGIVIGLFMFVFMMVTVIQQVNS